MLIDPKTLELFKARLIIGSLTLIFAVEPHNSGSACGWNIEWTLGQTNSNKITDDHSLPVQSCTPDIWVGFSILRIGMM